MSIEDMLQRRFVEYSGYQFQKLFYEIMRNKYDADFDMPQPYGNVGDFKSDGYLRTTGTFFACYAPENPSDDTKASSMISKLISDLEGLQINIDNKIWQNSFNEFTFVVNMKYSNIVPAPLLVKKEELQIGLIKKYRKKIKINILTQYDLKITFNTLTLSQQRFILEKVYIHDADYEFDGSIISKIIEHFMHTKPIIAKPHNIMDFDNKIIFNGLSKERGDSLSYASYNISSLEMYLESLSSDSCSCLQNIVVKLYEEAIKEYPDNTNLQFDYVCNNLFVIDDETKSIYIKSICDTRLIIMSKFFENCSIFKSEG